MIKQIKLIFISFAIITFATGCVNTDDTLEGTTVTDIDGNLYHTIKIGTQTWMIENLKTTKYRNGEVIDNVTDNVNWVSLKKGAWCDYNNDESNGIKYGHLYNFHTVVDSRILAPVGWHVASDSEWAKLEKYVSENLINSISVAKALAGNNDWSLDTHTGAIGNDLTRNNSSGFDARPGGNRNGYSSGAFENIGRNGTWWTSSQINAANAWSRSFNCVVD